METMDFERWRTLLVCPSCRRSLHHAPGAWTCGPCGRSFPIKDGRPIFHDNPNAVRVMPVEHLSNQLTPEIRAWIRHGPGLTLNIGAGGTIEKLPNCVEFEYTIFRHTDIVGDAHHLPFADGAFDAVVTFNTFEHLHTPTLAAGEIYRVLKPGGRLILQTAFLQPLHEPPHHYYNTTEFGLRRWFRDFDITELQVSENFNPAFVLAWVSSASVWSVAHELGPEAARELGRTTLDDWRSSWENEALRAGPGWDILRRLSQECQKQFAAGFQLEALKPAASRQNPPSSLAASLGGVAHRLADRGSRWRRSLFPEGGVRHRGYQKGRQAVRIWRQEGFGGLVRRITRQVI